MILNRPCRLILLFAFVQTSMEALADSALPATPGLSAAAMLQSGLGLLLVFGILFLAAYLIRKFNPGQGFGRSGPLRVVGGLVIGTRERIVLIEVEDTWLVVGIGPGQIRTLHTMTKGESPPSAKDEKPFADWLNKMIERKNEPH